MTSRFPHALRIGTEAARQALSGRAEVEADAWVREEIAAPLSDEETWPRNAICVSSRA